VNSHQAREVLLLYRPGISDPTEPEIAEALACSQNDPELQRWFQDHCAFQETIRQKFKQITVPEGLKEQIISERQVIAKTPVKRTLVLVSVCVTLLFLSAAVGLQLGKSRQDKTFANFQSRMVRIVARSYPKMDLESSDASQIRETLARRGAYSDFVLPQGLTKASYTGCAALEWQGKKVSMVCFSSGKDKNSKDPDLFLFVIKHSDAPNSPQTQTPAFARRSGLTTAAWTAGNKTYLLAGMADEAELKAYF